MKKLLVSQTLFFGIEQQYEEEIFVCFWFGGGGGGHIELRGLGEGVLHTL